MIGRWGSRLTFDGTKKGFGMTGLHELFIISTWRFHELYMTANAFLAHPSTHQKSVSHEFFVGITHLPQLIFVYWNSPYPLTAPVDSQCWSRICASQLHRIPKKAYSTSWDNINGFWRDTYSPKNTTLHKDMAFYARFRFLFQFLCVFLGGVFVHQIEHLGDELYLTGLKIHGCIETFSWLRLSQRKTSQDP